MSKPVGAGNTRPALTTTPLGGIMAEPTVLDRAQGVKNRDGIHAGVGPITTTVHLYSTIGGLKKMRYECMANYTVKKYGCWAALARLTEFMLREYERQIEIEPEPVNEECLGLRVQKAIRELDMCSDAHGQAKTLHRYIKDKFTELNKLNTTKPGFVYFMRTLAPIVSDQKRHAWKIGMSANPKERRKKLEESTAMGSVGLEIYSTIKTDDCRQLESTIHFSLREYRIKGEWFDLDEALERGIPQISLWRNPGKYDFQYDVAGDIRQCERDLLDILPKAMTFVEKYWADL
jgi:hypothetical protein